MLTPPGPGSKPISTIAPIVTASGDTWVTSLLGAGCLLHSGVFHRDDRLVRGPELDAEQTGYGPGYRLYRGGDGAWFALVIPDRESWGRLASLPEVDGLPTSYVPLRAGARRTDGRDADARRDDGHADAGRGHGGDEARRAEAVPAAAFATASADTWVERLRTLGAVAEPVAPLDRDGFRRGVLDDPVNRQLGRAISYATPDWGHFEQVGPLVRYGPDAGAGPRLLLPGVGEHTVEILRELGTPDSDIPALLDAKIAAAPRCESES
ncbi:CoA transferase [Cryptosporangium minutisporangium]